MAEKKTLYDILGIGAKSDDKEIKKAYRDRAKEAHPDTAKGSEEEFREVSRAYSILISPHKRKIYDATGLEDDSPLDPNAKIKAFIQELFQKVISEKGSETNPIFEVMRHYLNKKIKEVQKQDKDFDRQIEKLKVFQRNIKGKDNFFQTFLEGNMENLKRNKGIAILEIEKLQEALKFLEGYEYSFEEALKEQITNQANQAYAHTGANANQFFGGNFGGFEGFGTFTQ